MTNKPKIARSIPESAERYGLSEGFLYDLAGKGRLPGRRRLDSGSGRGLYLIHSETFELWLASGTGDEQRA